MIPRLRISSYFSEPVDLAAGVLTWPEFSGGTGYDADFRNEEEEVQVRFVAHEEDCLVISSSSTGALLDRVCGYVVRRLSSRSDYVMVYEVEKKAQPADQHNAGDRPPMNGSSASDTPSSPAPRG